MTATMPFLGSGLFGALSSSLSSGSRSKPRALWDMKDDERGAVMLTGLFMSCFLIGSLWFIVGIGDTVVFRDKMQEATDHGAFTSAALHAKGMNFICLCNLVMLALVTVHIIMGVINDVLFAVCLAAGIESFGTACIPYLDWHEDVWQTYFDIMNPALTGLHDVAKVAAAAYPYVGLIEGIEVGHSYKTAGTSEIVVLPVSESMIPAGGKAGLPVAAQPMNYLCLKVATDVEDLFDPVLKHIPSIARRFVKKFLDIVAKGVQERYCNSEGGGTGSFGDVNAQAAQAKLDAANKKIADDNQKNGTNTKSYSASINGLDPGFNSFWGNDGPYTIYSKGANGATSFQVFAINIAPSYDDAESESHVGIARGPTKGADSGMQKYTKKVQASAYLAQAEFYFDCDDTWASDACNNQDNATFTIGWRARLKPFSFGAQLDKVLGIATNGLADIGNIIGIGSTIGNVTGQAGALLNGGGITGFGPLAKAFENLPTDIKNITGH